MSITTFDVEAAKLQVKLLEALGDPVPDDVKALSEYPVDPSADHHATAEGAENEKPAEGDFAGWYLLLHVPGHKDLVVPISPATVNMHASHMEVTFPDASEGETMYKKWHAMTQDHGLH